MVRLTETNRLVEHLDKGEEIALRDRAITYTIKYFENKDLVTLDAFQAHWERVYDFLKNGKTKD
jgi:hypothetical protein